MNDRILEYAGNYFTGYETETTDSTNSMNLPLPKIELSQFNLPKVELPKIEFPNRGGQMDPLTFLILLPFLPLYFLALIFTNLGKPFQLEVKYQPSMPLPFQPIQPIQPAPQIQSAPPTPQPIIQVAEAPPPPPIPPMSYTPQPVTNSIDLKNKRIDAKEVLFTSRKPGKLVELVLHSSNKNYSVRLEIDGYIVLDRSFDDLVNIAPYSDTIGIVSKTDEYVLSLRSYSWQKSARFTIYVNEPITFSSIFIKYDEYVD